MVMNLFCNRDCCKVGLKRNFLNDLSSHSSGILSLVSLSVHTELQWAQHKCQVRRVSYTPQVKVNLGKVLTRYLGLGR